MVIRFLFCLIGSLLSGSVIAVVFTAFVQFFFPDNTQDQKPQFVKLATLQEGRSAPLPREPAPPVRPIPSVALAAGVPELAQPSELNSPAAEGPPAIGRSESQATEPRQDPELAALVQDGARSKEQLSASAAADLLPKGDQEAEVPMTAPDLPAQQDKPGIPSIAEVSAKAPGPESNSSGQEGSQENKPTIAADTHARTAAGVRPTQGRSAGHVSRVKHAHRRQSDHQADHRLPIRQAQRLVQE